MMTARTTPISPSPLLSAKPQRLGVGLLCSTALAAQAHLAIPTRAVSRPCSLRRPSPRAACSAGPALRHADTRRTFVSLPARRLDPAASADSARLSGMPFSGGIGARCIIRLPSRCFGKSAYAAALRAASGKSGVVTGRQGYVIIDDYFGEGA